MATTASARERVAHVVRRLSMGPHAVLLDTLADTDAAISLALDLSAPASAPPTVIAPDTATNGGNAQQIAQPITWWFEQMIAPHRMIEERLVWFWHDHFATSLAKVRFPYLMWTQHLTIRRGATGSFAELLVSVATDPAMLLYLDGAKNTVKERNENFGRECLELFTMGRDNGYTQDDVVAASRAFTGWAVDIPGRATSAISTAPWRSAFVARRHDSAPVTLFGLTGALDLPGAIDRILAQPATALFIVAKLYRELVGASPDDATLRALSARFAADWQILPLVEAIVATPAFTSDAAVRAKYRSPVERVVAIAQAGGVSSVDLGPVTRRAGTRSLAAALAAMDHLPFAPPNVAGFPKGERLVGPGQLAHHVDLVAALRKAPTVPTTGPELLARFGLFDVSETTLGALAAEPDTSRRFALAATAPEMAVL